MKQPGVAREVRLAWTPFSLDPRTEWWVFILGPFALLFLGLRVWRNRHRPIGD